MPGSLVEQSVADTANDKTEVSLRYRLDSEFRLHGHFFVAVYVYVCMCLRVNTCDKCSTSFILSGLLNGCLTLVHN